MMRRNSGSGGWRAAVRICGFSTLLLAAVLSALLLGEPLARAADSEVAASSNKALAAGTVLYVRLETEVSTRSSHLHAPISARLVREVDISGGAAIPVGAVVRGKIDKLIPSSSPTDRARLLMRFTEVELPGRRPVPLDCRVSAVENARETVLPDGTVQGLLASELPVTLVEGALGKIGQGGTQSGSGTPQPFGKGDTSIAYPKGTDLELTLTQPWKVEQVLPSSMPSDLADPLRGELEKMLAGAPLRVTGKDGEPGDPLNLIFVGSDAEIRRAFAQAGWYEPERASGKAVWDSVRAIVQDTGFGKAPVSDLFLFGRHQDLAFAKMLNTVAKRHHLRLWRTTVETPEGRAIWVAAATHDNGYDIRPGVISHAIDPDIDAERAKVAADLIATGCVAHRGILSRANPVTQGQTSTGAPWHADGRVEALELKSPGC